MRNFVFIIGKSPSQKRRKEITNPIELTNKLIENNSKSLPPTFLFSYFHNVSKAKMPINTEYMGKILRYGDVDINLSNTDNGDTIMFLVCTTNTKKSIIKCSY